jgi:hypothetical protein
MFAITIGEIGLQVAYLVQAGHVWQFLPAYTHLWLATFAVAVSWVGWSKSTKREDVQRVFEFAFIVLLLDMAMVVTYFILVRTVDFSPEGHQRIDGASDVAKWHIVIFALYLIWDLVTKVLMYRRPDHVRLGDGLPKWRSSMASWLGSLDGLNMWFESDGVRMIPTIFCLGIAWVLRDQFKGADKLHWITADFALVFLILLFRALKDWISWWQDTKTAKTRRKFHLRLSICLSCLCFLGVFVGAVATRDRWRLPFSSHVIDQIVGPTEEFWQE